MAAKKVTPKGKKRGPKPETLKIEGDWRDAVGRALQRGKPPKEAAVKKKTDNGPDA